MFSSTELITFRVTSYEQQPVGDRDSSSYFVIGMPDWPLLLMLVIVVDANVGVTRYGR